MGRIIGYGKLGRSMPLTLERCGNLGGDVEMAAVVKEMAHRHPDDTFVLVGRNDGSKPSDVGLPSNVVNPWADGWLDTMRDFMRSLKASKPKGEGLTTDDQIKIVTFMDELTGVTFENLDAMVMWVGQHGTTNAPIQSIQQPWTVTKPYDWSIYYASYMLRGINRWRDVDPWNREEISLNADARNHHKMRDLKWPLRHPILGQYNYTRALKHHRYGALGSPATVEKYKQWEPYVDHTEPDPFLWCGKSTTVYARLEVNGLRPGTPFGDLISYNEDWYGRGRFGLFINEARAIGIKPEMARLPIFKEWVAPLDPDFVHGTWSDKAKLELGRDIQPAPWSDYYPRLHSVRCTLTTPSSGSGWATAKPWEAFAAGTVCFFHPAYDSQDNILGDADPELKRWLRVPSPSALKARVQHLNSEAGISDWRWLVHAQREHFNDALRDLTYMQMIEKRIYG